PAERASFGKALGKVLASAGGAFSGVPFVSATPGAAPGAASPAAQPVSAADAMFNALTYNLIMPFKDADGVAVAMCRPARPVTRAEMAQMGFDIVTEDSDDAATS